MKNENTSYLLNKLNQHGLCDKDIAARVEVSQKTIYNARYEKHDLKISTFRKINTLLWEVENENT